MISLYSSIGYGPNSLQSRSQTIYVGSGIVEVDVVVVEDVVVEDVVVEEVVVEEVVVEEVVVEEVVAVSYTHLTLPTT